MKKTISVMLKDLCCSRCKSDFDENSVEFIHKDNDYNVIHLVCQNCGKDFGKVFLKLGNKSSKNQEDIVLKDSRDIPPINYDDILDAHEYIKDIEINLKKYLEN